MEQENSFTEGRRFVRVSEHDSLPAGNYRIRIEEDFASIPCMSCFDSFTEARDLSLEDISLFMAEPIKVE